MQKKKKIIKQNSKIFSKLKEKSYTYYKAFRVLFLLLLNYACYYSKSIKLDRKFNKIEVV